MVGKLTARWQVGSSGCYVSGDSCIAMMVAKNPPVNFLLHVMWRSSLCLFPHRVLLFAWEHSWNSPQKVQNHSVTFSLILVSTGGSHFVWNRCIPEKLRIITIELIYSYLKCNVVIPLFPFVFVALLNNKIAGNLIATDIKIFEGINECYGHCFSVNFLKGESPLICF